MLNDLALQVFRQSVDQADRLGCAVHRVADATLLDAGITKSGSLQAGLVLARLCLADLAEVSVGPGDRTVFASDNLVHVRTDHPLSACLGAQYAGWPVQTDDFFAMGSGPMRMVRGREEALQQLQLSETGGPVVGVLESDSLATESAVALISDQCAVSPADVHLAMAPSTSIAGSLQVVARSVETAMHKLHELGFDVRTVISATGSAPLPPPARRGDTVGGVGRTNDAILYGATVTLWVEHDDDAIEEVAAKVPSSASGDHGLPFAALFKQYDCDFYKVDPLLFSPAVVTIHNSRSGRTWNRGQIKPDVLHDSFLQ